MINELTNINLLKKGGQKEVYTAIHDQHGKVSI